MKIFNSEIFASKLIISGIIAFALVTVLFFIVKKETLGLFGDIIGGLVGSIWALAGVILFYSALKSQQAALEDQRQSTKATIDAVQHQSQALELQMKEFELQRKELEETRKVFQEQSDTLNVQRFEGSFFKLLDLKRSLFEQIFVRIDKGHNIYGVEAYLELWREFEKRAKRDLIGMGPSEIRRNLVEYVRVEHVNSLEPYFALLYHTLNILDKADIQGKDDYASIFVTQLIETDKLFLFYYGSMDSPGNHLKPLLEKFAVLRYLNDDKLIDSMHRIVYKAGAYVPERA